MALWVTILAATGTVCYSVEHSSGNAELTAVTSFPLANQILDITGRSFLQVSSTIQCWVSQFFRALHHVWAVLACDADFEKLSTAAEYEAIIRDRVSGVPEHWVADIAQQCLHASPSPQGRRHALCTGPCMLCTRIHTIQRQSMGLTDAVADMVPCKSGCPCAVQGKPNMAHWCMERAHHIAAVSMTCCHNTAFMTLASAD